MKKLLFLLLMSLSLFAAQAQTGSAKDLAIVAGDTVSTSSSLDTVSKVITVTDGYSAMGIQVIGTRSSGTVTSKAYMYVSNDGVDYDLTDSTAAFANSGRSSRWFSKTSTPWNFYKVQVRPPSAAPTTEVLAVKIYLTTRRYRN